MGEACVETEGSEKVFVGVHLTLRSQQVAYLQHLASCSETFISEALCRILDKKMQQETPVSSVPARKVRKHLMLTAQHLEFIDRMGAKAGLSRSDIARRLIDEARTQHSMISVLPPRAA